jgi:DNA invertase Pin-like site-specific DNA recombinase
MRAVIYSRTSTSAQSTGIQLKALNEMVKRSGYDLVDTIQDEGVSGTRRGSDRSGMKKVMMMVNQRLVDVVLVYSVDRIGRKLSDVISIAEQFQDKGVGLIIHKNGIDTTTSHGKHLLNFFALIAEMEKDFIISRVQDGMALARSKGKQIGRAKISDDLETQIINLRKKNIGMVKIGKMLGVGTGTVQRVVKEQAALQAA